MVLVQVRGNAEPPQSYIPKPCIAATSKTCRINPRGQGDGARPGGRTTKGPKTGCGQLWFLLGLRFPSDKLVEGHSMLWWAGCQSMFHDHTAVLHW